MVLACSSSMRRRFSITARLCFYCVSSGFEPFLVLICEDRKRTRTTARVNEAHARSFDVDQHLTRSRLRSLDLTELKDLRSTSLHRTNCLEAKLART
jgi:hypothetical protein